MTLYIAYNLVPRPSQKLYTGTDCGTIQVTTHQPGSLTKPDHKLLKAMLEKNQAMIKQSINLSNESNSQTLRPVPHSWHLKQNQWNQTQNIFQIQHKRIFLLSKWAFPATPRAIWTSFLSHPGRMALRGGQCSESTSLIAR